MKGLIHSKKFRQNLYKWLFMYIGVLGLFATVVTYSKYISSFGASDEARVTKFNVKLTFLDSDEMCASGSTALECNTGTHLPYEDMIYYFKVDTSELEVNSELWLTAKFKGTVSDNYQISEIAEKRLVDGEEKFVPITDRSISDEANVKTGTINVDSSNRGETIYRVTVKYKGDYNVSEADSSYSLYVGYSANQIKTN